jgi:hypothetical protein
MGREQVLPGALARVSGCRTPAVAIGCFPGAYTLMNLLPFLAFGWLAIGVVAAIVLRTRRPATFHALGRSFPPARPASSAIPRSKADHLNQVSR